MKPANNQERLLNDVLSEGVPAGFREALLGQTLRLARRRRWSRRARSAGGALAVLALLVTLLWRSLPPRQLTPEVTNIAARVVRTRPLPENELVPTRPLAPDRLVSTAASATVVQTPATDGQFRVIDDHGLLAFVGDRPVALVRRSPHSAELVFVNPADREALLGD